MQLSDFDYYLPKELIARYPLDKRSNSRLLSMSRNQQTFAHRKFVELPDLLQPGDLLVFNDTKVIAARLFGHKSTGGKVEVLIERLLGQNRCLAQIRASKAPTVNSQLVIAKRLTVDVVGRDGQWYELQFPKEKSLLDVLSDVGQVPLPPYIERQATTIDETRYQTVYAKHHGAVAAPTAGLHFDEDLFAKLRKRQIEMGYMTLHVAAGTFQPVRCENILQHKMHAEYLEIPEELCQQIIATKQQGKRVIAVGTTVVRGLETALQAKGKPIQPFQGDTQIFIYPGYHFRCIDGLITNFHLPKSTLLMLVAAFANRELILAAYQEAIRLRYRFYSYGDAMLLL